MLFSKGELSILPCNHVLCSLPSAQASRVAWLEPVDCSES
jgi:hypothetical protein